MNPRWLGLVLVAWSAIVATASAQTIILLPKSDEGERPSHRPIAGGLENDMTPERRLANRLQHSRARKGELDRLDDAKLDDDMKELIAKLLRDRKFMESLKDFKQEDIDRITRMQQSLGGDPERFANDPALKKLIEQSMQGQKLTEKDRELIDRWKQKTTENGGIRPPTPPTPPTPPGGKQPPVPPQPPPGQTGQTPPGTIPPVQPKSDPGGKMPDWMKKDLDRAARDFGKWLDTPNGKSARDRLLDATKRAAQAGKAAPPVGDRVKGVGKYLPKPGNWVSNRVMPRPSAGVGALPRLPSPSSMPTVSASGAGKALAVVAVVAVLLFVLWHSRGWVRDAIAARLAKSWKLGPWPVRPDQVSTRAELVRAFEYLALLCLGPAARTSHHLDLGRQIGDQPSLDPDRRRDAARTLARLYEQARYTPDDEPLSPADMADARRELSILAGEQAA